MYEMNNMEEIVKEITEKVKGTLFVIEKLMEDEDYYKSVMEEIYDYMKEAFEYEEVRKCPTFFKFKEDGDIYMMELRDFLVNLMFWQPIMELGGADILDSSYIVDVKNINTGAIKNYIDTKIIPSKVMISNSKKNAIIHDMLYDLSRISTDFNVLFGLTINLESFINVANSNPRFDEIIRTKFPDNMQPKEIESALDSLQKETISILSTEDNCLKPILLSGTGIKHKQLVEFTVNGGFKPDLDGNTIPIPINTNFVVGGLSSVTNYFIDATGGRKALIMNKSEMGRSGHFSRMIMLLTSDVKTSPDEDKCNSVNPVLINVKTKKHLKKLRGRHYRILGERTYKILTGDEEQLIGQDILIKSPITCTGKHGICKTCYGELFNTNKDLNSVGGFAGTVLTEPVSQNILSSKHLLTTDSESVEIEGDNINVLNVYGNEITLNLDNDDVDFKNIQLVLNEKDVETFEQFDDKSEFNLFTNTIYLRDKSTGNIYKITETGNKCFYLTPELAEMVKFKSGAFTISLEHLEDISLFKVEISNNELTKPLYDIMDLLNNKNHLGLETIDDVCQALLDLIVISGIDADSVHLETIIRAIVRSADNILEFPDFSKYSPKYNILTVASALEKNPSVFVSMSFQALKRQLTDPLTFKKKKSSHVDPFFE